MEAVGKMLETREPEPAASRHAVQADAPSALRRDGGPLDRFARTATGARRVQDGMRRGAGHLHLTPLAGFLARNTRYAIFLLVPLATYVLVGLAIGGVLEVLLAAYFFAMTLLIINQAVKDVGVEHRPAEPAGDVPQRAAASPI